MLPLKIFGIIQSFQRTAALKAAIDIDLFTAISDQGSTAEEIAACCKASSRGTRVLCDYFCVIDLLRKRSGRYWLTEDAALYLDRRSPQFIADVAIQTYAGGALLEGFENLEQAVRNGGTALSGAGTVAPEHPYWTQFARALAPIGAANAALLAKSLDLSCSAPMRILDIACGHGHYGIAIAKQI